MKEPTRYQYEKRIRELQDEIRSLSLWRDFGMTIFDTTIETISKNENISRAWIIQQFKYLLK